MTRPIAPRPIDVDRVWGMVAAMKRELHLTIYNDPVPSPRLLAIYAQLTALHDGLPAGEYDAPTQENHR